MARRPHRRNRPGRGAPAAVTQSLTIERLGAAGDGLSGPIAVPFALPGETVTAAVSGKKGDLRSVETPSPARIAPVCRHFGRPGDGCGGCRLQHLAREDYLRFKTARLRSALSRAGFTPPEPRVFSSPPKSRRRAKLAFAESGGRMVFGFRALSRHEIVPMTECHVLDPALFSLAGEVAALLSQLPLKGPPEAALTLTPEGADVDIFGVDEDRLAYPAREAAALFAEKAGIARLSLGGVPLAERRVPALGFGGVPVALPPGGFLQATREGEAQLVSLVEEGVGAAPLIADLFCGIGTFALPLSRRARILAAEGAPQAAAALSAAARAAGCPIEVLARDLFERPLAGSELAGVGAAVLDPPRAGAQAQTAALAAERIERIVYVSCDPAALARDAAMLASCYRLSALSLVDQFTFSPHIEAVAVFERSA